MSRSAEHWSGPLSNSAPSAMPSIALTHPILPGQYYRWKYWFERCLAVVLLLPGLVVIVAVALLVRLTSPGPAIYRQLRVGREGRHFWMYKIRTMRRDAEAASGPVWARQDDPRVTPLGRVLRKVHLDEFPQLFNVLKGEMTLIGPRPERPEFTQQLAARIPHYLERLAVLPGITGLAQINLPPDSDLESVRRKLAIDLEYIATASWFLDARMLLCTAVRLLGIHGETAMRLFGLKRAILGLQPDPTNPSGELRPHGGGRWDSDAAVAQAYSLAGHPFLRSADGHDGSGAPNHFGQRNGAEIGNVNHHNEATTNGSHSHELLINGKLTSDHPPFNGNAVNDAALHRAAENGADLCGKKSKSGEADVASTNGASNDDALIGSDDPDLINADQPLDEADSATTALTPGESSSSVARGHLRRNRFSQRG